MESVSGLFWGHVAIGRGTYSLSSIESPAGSFSSTHTVHIGTYTNLTEHTAHYIVGDNKEKPHLS